MAERCAAAGISIKYGKKLMGKLEKAVSVRESLIASLASGSDARLPSMELLLEEARSLRRHALHLCTWSTPPCVLP